MRAAAGRIFEPLEEAAFSLPRFRILVHHPANRFGHYSGHGLVAFGGEDPEAPKQGLGQAEGYVLERFNSLSVSRKYLNNWQRCSPLGQAAETRVLPNRL